MLLREHKKQHSRQSEQPKPKLMLKPNMKLKPKKLREKLKTMPSRQLMALQRLTHPACQREGVPVAQSEFGRLRDATTYQPKPAPAGQKKSSSECGG